MKRNVWVAVAGLGVLACAGTSSTAQGPCEAYFDACVKSAPDARAAFLAQCHLDVNGPGRERLGPRLGTCAEAARQAPAACGEAACATPPGTLSGGAACVENEQCESGTCNHSGEGPTVGGYTYPAPCGTCAVALHAGDPCLSGGGICVAGLRCAQGTCRLPAALGERCLLQGPSGSPPAELDCEGNLYCESASGICARIPGMGESCESRCLSPFRCIGGVCGEAPGAADDCTQVGCPGGTLWCNALERKCQEKLVVGAGSACGSESVRCDVGLVCVRGGDRAYCAAPVLRGGACTPERTAPCEAHTICLRGKCDLLDPSACR
ncbi:MAG: hypothetical protein HOO96_08405 [Polyangiaceae bacterium]|nr:hypothetical protein [Polyangiaceae bacterium]